MVDELARGHGRQLTKTQRAQILSPSGDEGGCLSTAIYPFKEIFRELAFWMEWRRTINIATQAYYSGFLLDQILGRKDFDPVRAPQYGSAIARAKRGVNTRLVYDVIRRVFLAAKGVVRTLARWLYQLGLHHAGRLGSPLWRRLTLLFRRRVRTPSQPADDPPAEYDRLARLFDHRKPEVRELLEGLVESLQEGLGHLPKDHLDDLRRRLDEALNTQAG